MIRIALAVLLLFALPLRAEEGIVAGLSQDRVAITATFHGSEILVFGAVKREAPAPDTGPLQVIVVVKGPSQNVTVRRKAKKLNLIWVNSDVVEVDEAPSFYAVATSGPLNEVLSDTEDLRYHITIPRSIRLVGETKHVADVENFAEAVIRIRSNNELYRVDEGAVELSEETLFNTRIKLPSNLTEGDYHARIFLTRNREVVSSYDTVIGVRKVGMERWVYNLAHEQPFIYGLMSLIIAVAAGWSASAVFRIFQRN